jgi:hypothetical protein
MRTISGSHDSSEFVQLYVSTNPFRCLGADGAVGHTIRKSTQEADQVLLYFQISGGICKGRLIRTVPYVHQVL